MLSARVIVEPSFYWHSRIIHTAVNMKIFNLLDSNPKTSNEISSEIGADRRAVELFLNALVGLRLLKKERDRYANSRMSTQFLVEGKERYAGYIIKHLANMWDSWGCLEDSVRSGRPVTMPNGARKDTDGLRSFILGMHNIASYCAPILARMIKLKVSFYMTPLVSPIKVIFSSLIYLFL